MSASARTAVTFYSLMYVSDRANDGAYLQKVDPRKRIKFYLRMALRLARGIHARFGARLWLITNNQTLLASLLGELGCRPDDPTLGLEQVEVENPFPEGIGYFSATLRVLLFDYFANRPGYSVMLDLDMICLPGPAEPWNELTGAGVPLVFDVTDQVLPAHGFRRVLEDFEKFGPFGKDIRWYGGEFIAGGAEFFREMSELARPILPRYGEVFSTLDEQGDEIMKNCCLYRLRASHSRQVPVDAGGPDIVRRHHGGAVQHDERRFGRIDGIIFLHLPAIKPLLSSSLSDRTILRLLFVAEWLPRWLAGRFLAAFGRLVGI